MKKGFTLIELLAVIVILAIIAVIAVPIVLNIIAESKENATLRSAEMYVKAAELSIAQSTLKDINIPDGTYNIANGDICLEDYDSTTKKCIDSIDEGTDIEILKVEVNGKVPTTGEITITNGNISDLSIVLDEKKITKNSNGDLVYSEPICKAVSVATIGNIPKGSYEPGDEYICNVDGTNSYEFVVVNKTDTTVSLVKTTSLGDIEYITTDKFLELGGEILYDEYGCRGGCLSMEFGPVTALSLTSSWSNIKNISMPTYSDLIPYGCDMPDYAGGTCTSDTWAVNLPSVWVDETYTTYYDPGITQPYYSEGWISGGSGPKINEKYNFIPKITISKNDIK